MHRHTHYKSTQTHPSCTGHEHLVSLHLSVYHTCHTEGACPPCTVRTTKLCRGDHKVRRVQRHQPLYDLDQSSSYTHTYVYILSISILFIHSCTHIVHLNPLHTLACTHIVHLNPLHTLICTYVHIVRS